MGYSKHSRILYNHIDMFLIHTLQHSFGIFQFMTYGTSGVCMCFMTVIVNLNKKGWALTEKTRN